MNILFLGDSITDCDHCFSPDNLGYGYVKYIHEFFLQSSELFSEVHIVNGGTDGFTFPRILQKWETMYTEHTWDIVCILCGINEVGHLTELSDHTAAASFRSEHMLYLKKSAAALNHLLQSLTFHHVRKIVLLQPFLFTQPNYLISWQPACNLVQHMITECASASPDICLLSLQEYFDHLSDLHGISALSPDGIHLTEAGHQKLAEYLWNYLCNDLVLFHDDV